MNGDGLVDVLRSQKIDLAFSRDTWLNQGCRAANPWVSELPAQNAGAEVNSYCFPVPLHYRDASLRVPYGFEQADINGDGLQDILLVKGWVPIITLTKLLKANNHLLAVILRANGVS